MKGSDDAGHRDLRRLASDTDQFLGAGFEARVKEDENGSDLCQGMDGVTGMNPAEGIWPQCNSRKDFAHNRRQMAALEDLSHDLRGDKMVNSCSSSWSAE